ncbi:anaphase promoting complex subunit CDC16 [Ascoidea rubescens DSM 1968]|uniref:Anaphase-promoting complex component n=1 Tax=Ascoidea rubescens DSM 1968 TaxID=1344418 RepID=A0A1D2VAD3_9ASCO|nr:anaphase-promoting complex component [Ascoidea rubescens DSM 1968]ODV58571.1 anaphase-promoting complex component [Ascoidea rubescens DSM 1968]
MMKISLSQPILSQADKLRLWRHDALMQHHYKTAEYIGDKILALTDDPSDAFWLAQVYYSAGNYIRAYQVLSTKELSQSIACRYLSGLCLTKLNRWDDALDVIGESNPFKREDNVHNKNYDGGVKLEASMCYLRGMIYANQNNFDRAKECYKEAVQVDAKCFEAFDELIHNNFLTAQEEWDFLNTLDFEDANDNQELVKLLYITRLNKHYNIPKFEEAESILKEEYNLTNNNDILLSRADLLFIQCKFQKCLEICEKILKNDEYNVSIMPNYLSCLHELGAKNKLFAMAHKLAQNQPTLSISWLAVGIYYLSINKISEARKYFSKASIMNPNFGQAWIGFAHTFAAEGEHEQAISAYATAARLFPGTHLPNLFLGMQYLQMNNLTLAEEYLTTSYQICNTDPLLLNEMGVIYYHKNDLKKAEYYFLKAFSASRNLNSDSKAWLSIHANLGHVYRRLNSFEKSLECFNQVLKISSKDANVYSAIGLVCLKMNKIDKAIENLHDALALAPSDPVANDLMKKALEENSKSSINNSQIDSLLSKRISSKGFIENSDTKTLAKSLIQGEQSSDEEDVMDIETD